MATIREHPGMADRDPAHTAESTPEEVRRRFRLEEFSDFLLYERGLAKRTVQAYLADCGSLADYVGDQGVCHFCTACRKRSSTTPWMSIKVHN